jgi:two-component system cell cycle sensor histidine kinase/response regulator CckA
MPGMNGLELSRRLLAVKPGLRTICMSGYPDATIFNEGMLGPETPFLDKPFTPDALLRMVREVLDKGRTMARRHSDSNAERTGEVVGNESGREK